MKHTIDHPVLDWVNGHILGNGDVGAVAWGHAGQVNVGLSKHDVNDLRKNHQKKGWNFTYSEIVERVIAGEREFLDDINPPRENRVSGPYPVSCGKLSLDLFSGTQTLGYSQTLSMLNAECRIESKPSSYPAFGGFERAPIEIAVFVHAESNLAIVTLDSGTLQNITWRYMYSTNSKLPDDPIFENVSGDTSLMFHPLPENQCYAAAVKVIGETQKCYVTESSIQGKISFGSDSGSVNILIGLVSNYDADDVKMSALALLDHGKAVSELQKDHYRWWDDFWNRSSISYEDDCIEKFWYFGLYALASLTRPETSPPHLQGIWNQYDVPPWHADFHFNTNLQESQWLACCSNHPELQEALVRCLTDDWVEKLRDNAREIFSSDGLMFPLCGDFLGREIGWGGLSLEMSLTAWMAQHLWWQWLYTQDKELLKEKLLPFFRECCEFYLSILKKRDDGLFHIEFSHSPEQIDVDEKKERYLVFGSDPTIDLVFIKILFKAIVETADILDTVDEFIERCRDVAENLPEAPVESGVLIDETIGFFKDGDRPGQFKHSHRHPSRLVGIYPGEEIGLHSDPEILELGHRSFAEFRSYGDSGFTGWSMAWQAIIAARLGLGDTTEEILKLLKTHYTFSGMLNSHNSLTGEYGNEGGALFQIEGTMGAATAVNEMLLQCTGGIIRLFPGVPDERSASFKNLRVPGAFLISADKSANEIRDVVILSRAGGMVKVANPWPGNAVRITCKNRQEKVIQENILKWKTKPGEKYKLSICN